MIALNLKDLIQWRKKLASFNGEILACKRVSFALQRSDPEHSTVKVDGGNLSVDSCFKCLLEFKVILVLKWKTFIRSIGIMMERSTPFNAPESNRRLLPSFYLHKSQITPEMNASSVATQSLLSTLKTVQNNFRGLVVDDISHSTTSSIKIKKTTFSTHGYDIFVTTPTHEQIYTMH